jgi:hypothetical protein
MQIRALSERVTRIRTELLVLGFFQDVRPVRGLAGEVDWIYSGIFSHLMKLQKLKGQRGEAMLLASESKLLTPKVLLVGLGPSPSYNNSILLQVLQDIRNRLAALKVKRFAMEAIGIDGRLMGWNHFFDAFLATFKGSSADQDLDITLLASGEEQARAINEQIRAVTSASDGPAIPPRMPDASGQSNGPRHENELNDRSTDQSARQTGMTKEGRKT